MAVFNKLETKLILKNRIQLVRAYSTLYLTSFNDEVTNMENTCSIISRWVVSGFKIYTACHNFGEITRGNKFVNYKYLECPECPAD